MQEAEVRTRIAPSPTGDPHVGTLYIALFNYVFAKHYNGKFILRIEDTDKARSEPIFEQNIFSALKWGNLSWEEGPDIGGDFGPYRQSERLDIYKNYINVLLDNDKAYKCFATQEELAEMREVAKKTGKKSGYDRRYRNLSKEEIAKREKEGQKYVVRLKLPLNGTCTFLDGIKGKIETPYADIDDQILLKSDGYPTYHFANVVDDHLMKISHVIRGDEWISSTPKHIYLYEAFGWKPPHFLHMPLLLGSDGKKLSKRRNPTSVFYFEDYGFLPDAMINFLSLMGYSMKDEKEIYSIEDLIKEFDVHNFGKSGAFFDIQKLKWLNQKYIIEKYSEEKCLEEIKNLYLNDDLLKKIIPLAHTRIKTFGDFFDLCDFFFKNEVTYTEELLCPKKISKEKVIEILYVMLVKLEQHNGYTKEKFEITSHEVAEFFDLNHRKIIMPILFVAIMGKKFGPPLFASIDILKKEKVRARVLSAIDFLGGISKKKSEALKKKLI